MKKSITLLITLFVTIQVSCNVKSDEKDDISYVKKKIEENKVLMAMHLINTKGLEKVSKIIDLSPLEANDIAVDGGKQKLTTTLDEDKNAEFQFSAADPVELYGNSKYSR